MTATNNNPWVVQAPKQSAPVSDGFHFADFQDVSDFTHEKIDGVKWKWVFTVKAGEHAGKTADVLTARDINPNTQAGRLIKGLLGRDLTAGENVKAAVDACKGKTYMIQVGPGAKGGKSAVRSVGDVPNMDVPKM